jgi:hypothetical protein
VPPAATQIPRRAQTQRGERFQQRRGGRLQHADILFRVAGILRMSVGSSAGLSQIAESRTRGEFLLRFFLKREGEKVLSFCVSVPNELSNALRTRVRHAHVLTAARNQGR